MLYRLYYVLNRSFYNNSFLYKVYYNLYRKHRGIFVGFPKRNTNIHLAGYPRSGNTFAKFLMEKSIMAFNSNLKVVSHNHSLAALKIANNLGINNVILLRNPEECIASSYLKNFALKEEEIPTKTDKELLLHKSLLYLDYYNFTNKLKGSNNFIISFDDLIQHPFEFISWLNNNLLQKSSMDLNRDEFNVLLLEFKLKEKGKNPLGSSLPNPVRHEFKMKVVDELADIVEMRTIYEIYNELIKKKLVFY